MNSNASLMTSLDRQARQVSSLPDQWLPVAILCDLDHEPRDLRAHVMTQNGRSTAVVITPAAWTPPDSCGFRLALPHDEAGWNVLETLQDAGVTSVEFHSL